METTEALYSAAVSTFESLAFAFADAVSHDELDGPIRWAGHAHVTFTGPWAGGLRVRLDEAALAAVTANMLGAEATPSVELQRDALGEFANVICGNVLPLLAGSGPIFELAPPAVSADVHWPEHADDGRTLLRLETGFAEVALHVDVPAGVSAQ